MGNFLDKDGVIRFKEKLLTEVDERIASGGGGSSGDCPTKEELIEATSRVTDVEVDVDVATQEELQTAVATVESNLNSKLSLSGGTMTGTIVSSGFFVQHSGDGGAIILRGGTDNTSANIALYGKNHPTNKGWFTFQATDGTNNKYLIGKPNGSLLWAGKNLIHVTDSWKSDDGMNWYRIWSDGRIEQGGWRTTSSNSTSSASYTFPKAFSTTTYTLILSKSDSLYGSNGHAWTGLNSQSTTGFNAYLNYVKKFHWYACGY